MANPSCLSVLRTSFLIVVASVVAGCGSSSSGPATPALSSKFSDIRVQTLNVSCALSGSCHSAKTGAPSGGLVLDASRPSAQIIADMKLIGKTTESAGQGPLAVPGDPTHSYLYHKIVGDLPCITAMTCGSRMPQTGPKIGDDHIQAIHDWIAGGMVDD